MLDFKKKIGLPKIFEGGGGGPRFRSGRGDFFSGGGGGGVPTPYQRPCVGFNQFLFCFLGVTSC
jgi:hypothetical protein